MSLSLAPKGCPPHKKWRVEHHVKYIMYYSVSYIMYVASCNIHIKCECNSRGADDSSGCMMGGSTVASGKPVANPVASPTCCASHAVRRFVAVLLTQDELVQRSLLPCLFVAGMQERLAQHAAQHQQAATNNCVPRSAKSGAGSAAEPDSGLITLYSQLCALLQQIGECCTHQGRAAG